jgi:hypothetical protein
VRVRSGAGNDPQTKPAVDKRCPVSKLQILDGRDVDAIKLSDKLNQTYGKDNYNVEVGPTSVRIA